MPSEATWLGSVLCFPPHPTAMGNITRQHNAGHSLWKTDSLTSDHRQERSSDVSNEPPASPSGPAGWGAPPSLGSPGADLEVDSHPICGFLMGLQAGARGQAWVGRDAPHPGGRGQPPAAAWSADSSSPPMSAPSVSSLLHRLSLHQLTFLLHSFLPPYLFSTLPFQY